MIIMIFKVRKRFVAADVRGRVCVGSRLFVRFNAALIVTVCCLSTSCEAAALSTPHLMCSRDDDVDDDESHFRWKAPCTRETKKSQRKIRDENKEKWKGKGERCTKMRLRFLSACGTAAE